VSSVEISERPTNTDWYGTTYYLQREPNSFTLEAGFDVDSVLLMTVGIADSNGRELVLIGGEWPFGRLTAMVKVKIH